METAKASLGFNIYPHPEKDGADYHQMRAFLRERGWRFCAGKNRLNVVQLLGLADPEKVEGLITEVRQKVEAECPGARVEVLRGKAENCDNLQNCPWLDPSSHVTCQSS